MSAWIPVSERLPDMYSIGTGKDVVLVASQHSGKWYVESAGVYVIQGKVFWEGAEGCDVSGVTHWTPMPEPPTT